MSIDISKIEKVVMLTKAYGATRIILFGSALERPEEANDIDIACDGIPGWKIYELSARLENELGIPVDILPISSKTRFIDYIIKKGKVLL